MSVFTQIQSYAKFAVAIVGALLTSATAMFPDNTLVKDWGPLVLSLLTAIAVYRIPNADPAGAHQDESVQPPDVAPGRHEA